MIGNIPKLVGILGDRMIFEIDIIRYNAQRDSIESSYGDGLLYSGTKVGNATLIIDTKTQKPIYFSGYREDSDFIVGDNDKQIIKACINATKSILG